MRKDAGWYMLRDVKPKSPDAQAIPVVLIVGGGASGTIAAARLLGSERARAGKLRVHLVESRPALGRGVAYGTTAPFHVLNVRHGRMSAFPEDAEHFSRWIARAHPAAMKNAFQPRSCYARYLASLLGDARKAAPAGAFAHTVGRAEFFARTGDGKLELRLASGEKVMGDRLILATGHRDPGVPSGLGGIRENPGFIRDPWAADVSGKIAKTDRVLLVGSGLTAVDFALSLFRSGHLAPVEMISRHGLLPLGHPVVDPPVAPPRPPFPDESVRGLFSALRAVAANEADTGWTVAIDGFRPHVRRVWEAWDGTERARFLRHARAYWDVHRHRVAPEVHREWSLYLKAGKLRNEAGRILGAEATTDGIRVRISKRRGGTLEKIYDRIVNCTGPAPDLSLVDGHGYAADPHGLGLATDAAGRPRKPDGESERDVFILGPALRARFWEMTAVPDLRDQAKVAVDAVLTDLP